jgi:2-dehydropantoate 2-reductase
VKAKIACNTLLLAYTNVKAFEQRRAAGRLP